MTAFRRLTIVIVNLVLFWCAFPVGLYFSGQWVDGIFGLPEPEALLRVAGGLAALAGLAFALWAIYLLKVKGKGLPISSLPPERFVAEGPYRYVRHPIYTGYVFLAGGLGLSLGSYGLTFVVVPVVAVAWFLTWVKLYEEPRLLDRFGDEYRVYRKRVAGFLPVPTRRVFVGVVLFLFRRVFKIRVTGRQHVPKRGAAVFISDHSSYPDFFFAKHVPGRAMAVPVTAEVFRSPVSRVFMKLMGAVPTRRFCPDAAAGRALADEFATGGAVGIAIEGERSWTGEMSVPAANVANNLLRFGCTIVPVAFRGSYRVWPRWAPKPDRRVQVTATVGPAFDLSGEAKLISGDDGDLAAAAARVLRDRIVALRDPLEPSIDVGSYPGARPELVLWRCPECGAEDCLSFEDSRWLVCGNCPARWDAKGGDLTLAEPQARAGVRDTIAGWVRRCPEPPRTAHGVAMATASCEFREDTQARRTLRRLESFGAGEALLFPDRLEWNGKCSSRVIPVPEIRSVTTERNDTLQLGIGEGVAQLVFDRSSPWRWQWHLERLHGER